MKITHAKLTFPMGPGKRLVTVCAELGSPNEYMTITVAVPNVGADCDIRECGIARARDYARQFSEISRQSFPARNAFSRGPRAGDYSPSGGRLCICC